MRLRCQPKNEYFSRSYEMKTVSSRRCPGAGSRTDQKCEAVGKDTKVEELNGEANERPGYSACHAGEACWANGCFVCTTSCLYYRNYPTPTSDAVNEIFSCPAWIWMAKVTLRLNRQNSTETQAIELEPRL